MKEYLIQTSDGETIEFIGCLVAETGDQVSMKFFNNASIANTNLFHSAEVYKKESGDFVVTKRIFSNYRDWETTCKAVECESLDEALNWLKTNDDDQGLVDLLKYA